MIGAGALGSPVALYLAGAGVGRLGHRRRRRRRALQPAPPAAALHARRGRAEGRVGGRQAALPEPRHRRRVLPVRVDETNVAGLIEGQDLVIDCTRLLRDALRRQRRLLRGRHRPRRGRRGGLERARDDDRPGAHRLLPLRVPDGSDRTRRRAPQAGVTRARRGRDRLAAGARGAQAPDRRARAADRRVPQRRPGDAGGHCACTSAAAPDCPDCGEPVHDAGTEHLRRSPASCAATSPPCASATPRRTASRPSRSSTGWPGLHALLAHRVAHALDAAGVPVAPARAGLRLARADRDRDPPARPGSATACSSTTAWAS